VRGFENLKVHFSSKKKDWETPQKLFDQLNKEFGPFDFDAAASINNAKCEVFLSPELDYDALKMDWKNGVVSVDKPKIWLNPPYGREIGRWVKKAYEESLRGCTVVALLPSRTDTRYFHDYIYKKQGVEIRFLRGRLRFVGATSSAPFPSMVVIFGKMLN